MRLYNEDNTIGKEEAIDKDTSETELEVTWSSKQSEVLCVAKPDSIENSVNDTGEEDIRDDNVNGNNAIDISNTVTELVDESNLGREKILPNSNSCIENHSICTPDIAEENKSEKFGDKMTVSEEDINSCCFLCSSGINDIIEKEENGILEKEANDIVENEANDIVKKEVNDTVEDVKEEKSNDDMETGILCYCNTVTGEAKIERITGEGRKQVKDTNTVSSSMAVISNSNTEVGDIVNITEMEKKSDEAEINNLEEKSDELKSEHVEKDEHSTKNIDSVEEQEKFTFCNTMLCTYDKQNVIDAKEGEKAIGGDTEKQESSTKKEVEEENTEPRTFFCHPSLWLANVESTLEEQEKIKNVKVEVGKENVNTNNGEEKKDLLENVTPKNDENLEPNDDQDNLAKKELPEEKCGTSEDMENIKSVVKIVETNVNLLETEETKVAEEAIAEKVEIAEKKLSWISSVNKVFCFSDSADSESVEVFCRVPELCSKKKDISDDVEVEGELCDEETKKEKNDIQIKAEAKNTTEIRKLPAVCEGNIINEVCSKKIKDSDMVRDQCTELENSKKNPEDGISGVDNTMPSSGEVDSEEMENMDSKFVRGNATVTLANESFSTNGIISLEKVDNEQHTTGKEDEKVDTKLSVENINSKEEEGTDDSLFCNPILCGDSPEETCSNKNISKNGVISVQKAYNLEEVNEDGPSGKELEKMESIISVEPSVEKVNLKVEEAFDSKSLFCMLKLCGGAPEDTHENENILKNGEISLENAKNVENETSGKKSSVDTTLSVEDVNSKEEEAIDSKSLFCSLKLCGGAPEDTLENENILKNGEISPENDENVENDTSGKKLKNVDTTLSVEEAKSKEEEAPEDTLENENILKNGEISSQNDENVEIDTSGKKLKSVDTTLSVEEAKSKEEEAIDSTSLFCTLKLCGGAPEETPGNDVISSNEVIIPEKVDNLEDDTSGKDESAEIKSIGNKVEDAMKPLFCGLSFCTSEQQSEQISEESVIKDQVQESVVEGNTQLVHSKNSLVELEKIERSSTLEEALKEMNELKLMVLQTNKKTLELSDMLREVLENGNDENGDIVWQRVQDLLLSAELEKAQLQGMTDAFAGKYSGNEIVDLDKNDEMKLKNDKDSAIAEAFRVKARMNEAIEIANDLLNSLTRKETEIRNSATGPEETKHEVKEVKDFSESETKDMNTQHCETTVFLSKFESLEKDLIAKESEIEELRREARMKQDNLYSERSMCEKAKCDNEQLCKKIEAKEEELSLRDNELIELRKEKEELVLVNLKLLQVDEEKNTSKPEEVQNERDDYYYPSHNEASKLSCFFLGNIGRNMNANKRSAYVDLNKSREAVLGKRIEHESEKDSRCKSIFARLGAQFSGKNTVMESELRQLPCTDQKEKE